MSTPRAPAAPVLPGETLAGKYKIERILGQGGMGIVVAARHLELDERVAIKFLLPSRIGDAATVERFLREARAAAKVKSEHVCRVFDVGRLETSGEPYLVMEYLEGTDLCDRLDTEGPLSVESASSFLIEACAALSEAHALGIVHRDLKPANIFLATRGDGGGQRVKVLDFGISKWTSAANDAAAMTSTSALIGSPAYMSPEQILSARTVDARADIWSLGVVLHELLTGSPPFLGDTVLELCMKIREQPPSSLADDMVSSGVDPAPPGFADVIAKCLAKDPAGRYPDVKALALALAPFADPEAQRVANRIRGGGGGERPSDPHLEIVSSTSTSTTSSSSSSTKENKEAEAEVSASASSGPASNPAFDATVMSDDAPAPLGLRGPAVVVGQVTLDPVSRVSADTEAEETASRSTNKPRRWLPAIGAVAALLAITVGINRLASEQRSPPPPPSSATSSNNNIAPSETLTTTASSTLSTTLPPPEPVVVASSSSSATLPPSSPKKPVIAAAAPVTTTAKPSPSIEVGAPTTVSAAAPSPDPTSSARRKRNLDRTDPYP